MKMDLKLKSENSHKKPIKKIENDERYSVKK